MIIWLASYPRSGNTLLRTMIKTVFGRPTYSKYDDRHEIGADAGVAAEVGHRFLGAAWPDAYDRLRRDAELYLVKTHDPPEDAGPAVYVVRDGRSACRSFFHYLTDFDRLDGPVAVGDVVAGAVPFGSWGGHLEAWRPLDRPNTLVVKYEDLIADPAREIGRLAAFTGLAPIGDWRNDFDRLHAMHPRFFRAGAKNDAAVALDGADLDLFWACHGGWMRRLGYAPPAGTAGTAAAGPPADERTRFRLAAASTADLFNASVRAAARVAELEREAAVAAARLDEARALSRAQFDHAAARESEWAARLVAELAAAAAGEAARTTADAAEAAARAAAGREAIDSLTRQLEVERATLNVTIGDLQGHRQEVIRLDLKAQAAEAALREAAGELVDGRGREAELSRDLRAAEGRLDAVLAPPVNRRPWPYVVPDARPLPATLPGGRPWPRITVVTPSFNHGRFVEQTILSVLNQNYPNLEYVLVDGGSTDETTAVVGRYADRIGHVVSEPDDGQSDAINKGFARATGELFAWVNSDDMLEPGALAAMAMAFHTSAADVVAGVCTLHADGGVVGRHMTACPPGPLSIDELLDLERCWLRGRFFYQPEVMFTRDLWVRAGGRLDVGLHFSMDYDLWLRFADQGARLHVIGRPVALYRVHAGQKTFSVDAYRPELTYVRDRFCRRTGRPMPAATADDGPPRPQLRVVFFNDLGPAGGAGIAHQRLAAAVATAGHVVVPVAIRPSLCRSELPDEAVVRSIADHSPDVVIVGNIHSAGLDPAVVGLIARRWPTVQVLHDLYPLTGRCAYTGDCGKFVTGCDDTCPTPGEYPALDPSRIAAAWGAKDQALRGGDPPVLAAVSRWTEDVARRRFAGGADGSPAAGTLPVRTPRTVRIRYGLPTDVFRPRDRSTCRDVTGLPQDRFIVLFSSSDLADRRKGLDHLIAALRSLDVPDLLAVCVGSDNADLRDPGFETRSTGYVVDERSLALLYGAADVFVGPSLVETFGQVFVEAAACGVPSVGYAAAGGVAEAVADGVSGLLAPSRSPAELAALIARLYGDPGLRRDLAAWGRIWAENEFSFRSCHHHLFAALDGLGLVRKLNVAPNVRFAPGPTSPSPVVYLDVPPPPPTAEQVVLAAARDRIAALQAEQDRRDAAGRAELAAARAAHEAERADVARRIEGIESERETLRAERDHREALIRQMAQTRAWRFVRAVYPIYRKTLGRSWSGKTPGP